MNSPTRRRFLQTAGVLAAGAAVPRVASAAAPEAAPLKLRVGLVTYNVAAKWDVPTLLKVCQRAGIASVELRTTHAHGVEPSLSKDQRADVKKRFADAGIEIWGCGTTCEFQSPDPAKVKEN